MMRAVLLREPVAVALTTGYWVIVRGGDLLQRVDNPRRALVERRVPRGVIYDRNGLVLADSAGQPGAWILAATRATTPFASLSYKS